MVAKDFELRLIASSLCLAFLFFIHLKESMQFLRCQLLRVVRTPLRSHGLYPDAAFVIGSEHGEDGFDLRCARAEVEQNLVLGVFLQEILHGSRQDLTELLILACIYDVSVDRWVDDAVGSDVPNGSGVALLIPLDLAHLLGEEEDNVLWFIVP